VDIDIGGIYTDGLFSDGRDLVWLKVIPLLMTSPSLFPDVLKRAIANLALKISPILYFILL
jgi:N-methylhydantoinase A/oxoprolinase/acetone carboxylase beta subunit